MRGPIAALFASAVILASPVSITAAYSAPNELSSAYNEHTDRDFRIGLQTRLAWTGDYAGRFDGDIGPATLRAIRDFQARNGQVADGVMTDDFLREVIARSDAAIADSGFAIHTDRATGTTLGLPLALVSEVGQTEVGTLWASPSKDVEIETVMFSQGLGLREVFDVLSADTPQRTVSERTIEGDSFVIRGEEAGRSFFIRFRAEDRELRGFSVAYAPDRAAQVEPYVTVADNVFEPFPAASGLIASLKRSGAASDELTLSGTLTAYGAESRSAGAATAIAKADEGPAVDSSGTGFLVSADGWLLTNAHVARSCSTLMVGQFGQASDVVIDDDSDLALVKVEGLSGNPLAISVEKPRLGEDILALGYPLRSILADSLNVTRGNVSSLMGLMNDPTFLQISAPVQPGNSGGPLIDLAGRVVGVVTAKLNAVAVADLTGDIPQSINFAIRTDVAASFLDEHGIDYAVAADDADVQSVPDATASVQDAVMPILCVGGR